MEERQYDITLLPSGQTLRGFGGDSLYTLLLVAGLISPKDPGSERLRLEKGDELHALETPDGIRLTVFDPELAAQMEVAEAIMREDRQVLHKLAQ